MNDPFGPASQPRVWRRDRGALVAGVCAGLAEDLDLPLPLIRLVTILFVLLPTGLAYLALALLLRRRQPHTTARPRRGQAGATGWLPSEPGYATSRPMPASQSWELLRQRFEMLEPRLKNMEAFVTSSDFELHRGFRRMGR